MSTPTVDIRPGRAARTYVVVFLVVWCTLLTSVVVRLALRGSPTVLVGLLMLVGGVLLLLRDGTVLPVQGARDGLPLLGHAAQDAQVGQLRAWLREG